MATDPTELPAPDEPVEEPAEPAEEPADEEEDKDVN